MDEWEHPLLITIGGIAKAVGDALWQRHHAYFVRAGRSVPSCLPDWLELMERIAASLGIEMTYEDVAPLIAKNFVNADQGDCRAAQVDGQERGVRRPDFVEGHGDVSPWDARCQFDTPFSG